MPLIIAFYVIFGSFGLVFNTLYFALFKGREEHIFGSKVAIFYFLHGLSLGPFVVGCIILLSLLVSLLALLGELIWLTTL